MLLILMAAMAFSFDYSHYAITSRWLSAPRRLCCHVFATKRRRPLDGFSSMADGFHIVCHFSMIPAPSIAITPRRFSFIEIDAAAAFFRPEYSRYAAMPPAFFFSAFSPFHFSAPPLLPALFGSVAGDMLPVSPR
jgi:hypothetical protein